MRILVVEDNRPVAGMIISAVEAAGHGVAGHARSVVESLQLLPECDCDIAILDVDLMGLSSGPVAEELSRRSIPFLVITGSKHLMEPAHQVAPFLYKPFRTDRLIQSLSSMEQEFKMDAATTARLPGMVALGSTESAREAQCEP